MSSGPAAGADDAGAALARPVHAEGGDKPFGQFTIAEARARAGELSAAAGWGPTARVAGVARGWSELAAAMEAAGVARVGDLDPDTALRFARRLWVTRSLL